MDVHFTGQPSAVRLARTTGTPSRSGRVWRRRQPAAGGVVWRRTRRAGRITGRAGGRRPATVRVAPGPLTS